MKSKNFTKASCVLALFVSPLLALGAANVSNKSNEVKAEDSNSTDYSAFMLRGGGENAKGLITPDAENNSLTYKKEGNALDTGFAVTDQFDTRAGNYSLKVSVNADSTWATPKDSTELTTGFVIYYNDANFITFYLKWNKDSINSIQEAAIWNRVASDGSNYNWALEPNGSFAGPNQWGFVDVFSDNSSVWFDENDKGVNLRTSSTILCDKGFDMTLNVERTTYKERVVDVLQIQIDALTNDGETKASFHTGKYAIDAMTNPKGSGASEYLDQKPQIGFTQTCMEDYTVKYSNIVFTNKSTESVSTEISKYGAAPEIATIDSTNNTIAYSNKNFASGFLMADLNISSSDTVDLEATVSGTCEDKNDTQLGFVYYFDDNNYAIIYLQWNNTTNTIAGGSCLIKVNGTDQNASGIALKPDWYTLDGGLVEYSSTDELNGFCTLKSFYTFWTDYGGWMVDSPEPNGIYQNFNDNNKIRSATAITIKSGFTFGLQRVRTTYLERVCDAFQLRFSAKDTSGVLHNWYSPVICSDAYTAPKGGGTSELINASPKIGFYTYNTDEISLSNFKCNGKEMKVSEYVYTAERYATNFMNKTETICTTSSDKENDLKGVWQELENDYTNNLSNEQKTILKESKTSSSSSSIIEKAMDRYDFIVSHYKSLNNFINRNVASPVSSYQNAGGNTTLTIVIISLVGTFSTCLIVGTVIITRRRKVEN